MHISPGSEHVLVRASEAEAAQENRKVGPLNQKEMYRCGINNQYCDTLGIGYSIFPVALLIWRRFLPLMLKM